MGTKLMFTGGAVLAVLLTGAVTLVVRDGDGRVGGASTHLATPDGSRATGGSPPSRSPRKAADADPFAEIRDLDPNVDEIAFLRDALRDDRTNRAQRVIRDDDSALAILGRVNDYGADPAELMWEFERFRSRVQTGGGSVQSYAVTGELTRVSLMDPDAAVEVVEFGPGRFVVTGANFWQRASPAQLEIRGAGRDRTTLVLSGDLVLSKEPLASLVVRDLTLEGQGTLDLRGNAAVILSNVRTRPARDGRIGSVVYGEDRTYFGARNCEFLGVPGKGGSTVIALRGPGLALFADCVFADLDAAVRPWAGLAAGSIVHFVDCTFDDTPAVGWAVRHKDQLVFPVRVRGATVRIGGPEVTDEKRLLAWGRDRLTEASDVTVVAGFAFSTLSDLLTVAETVRAPDGLSILEVRLERASRTDTARFAVISGGMVPHPAGGTTSSEAAVLVELTAGGVVAVEGRPSASGVIRPRDVVGMPPLVRVVRGASLPGDARIWKLRYAMSYAGQECVLGIELLDAAGYAQWVLHAATGAVLRKARGR